MMRRTTFTLLLLAAAVLGACHRNAAPDSKQAPLPAVTVATVAFHDVEGALTASGRLTPREEVAVTPDLNGYRVARVAVEEGARVAQGQVLAVLDDSLLVSQIDQVRASLAQQEASADQAREQASRVDGLDKAGVLSDEAIANRRLGARSAAAAAAATRAQLRDLEVRRSHLVIRAPTAGIVLERAVRPGDPSSTGSVMFRLARDSQLELYAELPDAMIHDVQPGDPAEVTLASGSRLLGHVRLIGQRVDTQTGLAIARIALPPSAELRQGGYAEARFVRRASVLAVPEAAVHYDADGASVLTVDRDSRVHRVRVRTGRHTGGFVELVAGPAAGTRVAVKGGAFTLEGDKVRIAPGAAR
ncbi:MAG: efflux RND transporter periplasmic adaptor subunit [Sphingomonadales bacterium]|nr:efflux RND transporter periplasmic adaptor subunit [Sphingomonadales bacterium]